MNVEIGTEAAQFPEKEYVNGMFLAVLQLITSLWSGSVYVYFSYILLGSKE